MEKLSPKDRRVTYFIYFFVILLLASLALFSFWPKENEVLFPKDLLPYWVRLLAGVTFCLGLRLFIYSLVGFYTDQKHKPID